MLTVALRHAGADPSFAIGGELTEGGDSAARGRRRRVRRRGRRVRRVVPAVRAARSRSSPTSSPTTSTTTAPPRRSAPRSTRSPTASCPAACSSPAPTTPGAARAGRRRAGAAAAPTPSSPTAWRRRPTCASSTSTPSGPGARFGLRADGLPGVALALRVPGAHNALNAAAAWAAGSWLGPDPDAARRRVWPGSAAPGAGSRPRASSRRRAGGRRLRPPPDGGGGRAARGARRERRRPACSRSSSRTCTAGPGSSRPTSARALGLADEVVVLDVYGAREDPEPGVTGELVARPCRCPPGRVVFEPDRQAAVRRVADRAAPGDVVLTLGAGDVTTLGAGVLARLAERRTGRGARGDDRGRAGGRTPRGPHAARRPLPLSSRPRRARARCGVRPVLRAARERWSRARRARPHEAVARAAARSRRPPIGRRCRASGSVGLRPPGAACARALAAAAVGASPGRCWHRRTRPCAPSR